MSSQNKILLPSKPKIIKEQGFFGIYEIDGLYPGYGHTLGNSLRRIILSSIEGAAITKVKIDGASHEFSAVTGIKEDVITMILNMKKLRFKINSDEVQTLNIDIKGPKEVYAKDISVPGQVEVLTPDLYIASVADKNSSLKAEIEIRKGLGFVSKEVHEKERMDIGSISVDAIFSPIRRVNYEVENMRVGDRTDFNKLRLSIETDGTLTPREALEKSIIIMIEQLKAVVGFKEEEVVAIVEEKVEEKKATDVEFLKNRLEVLNLSPRTEKALVNANIRTVGGLVRKKEADILDVEGIGTKGIQEIKKILSNYSITLK